MTGETFTLEDILDEAQITKLIVLWKKPGTTAEDLCSKIIEPNMGQINSRISILTGGQVVESHPKYIAYCCEYILRKMEEGGR